MPRFIEYPENIQIETPTPSGAAKTSVAFAPFMGSLITVDARVKTTKDLFAVGRVVDAFDGAAKTGPGSIMEIADADWDTIKPMIEEPTALSQVLWTAQRVRVWFRLILDATTERPAAKASPSANGATTVAAVTA